MDWFQDAFSICEHGLVKAYCSQCTQAADDAEKAEVRRAAEANRRVQTLESTVERQSDALDDAYSYIRELERRRK